MADADAILNAMAASGDVWLTDSPGQRDDGSVAVFGGSIIAPSLDAAQQIADARPFRETVIGQLFRTGGA
jgi:acyl-CoA thioesterase